jgi:hypothetical protein
MSLVYGYDVESYNDHLLVVARKMAELGSAVLPGTVLVNEIPLCKLSYSTQMRRKWPTETTHRSETHSRVDTPAKL